MPATRTQQTRHAVLVCGCPLPGRAALARALERRLPGARRLAAPGDRIRPARLRALVAAGSTPVIECDLPTAAARAQARELVEDAGAAPVFAWWRCEPEDVDRELYHRYASLPRRYADHWMALWRADRARREPFGEELRGVATAELRAHAPLPAQVAVVAQLLGVTPLEPTWPEPARRVLLVDDDAGERAVVAEALAALGCEVIQAADGAEALRIAEEEALDLVISDQQMPGMSGIELARRLVALRPELVVVLLTGWAEETVEGAVAEEGVALLLAKPARAADLVRVLDDLADGDREDEVPLRVG